MAKRQATFARYRHGRVKKLPAKTINPKTGKLHEYRVGPVPPADGIAYPSKKGNARYVDLKACGRTKNPLQGANYFDILEALSEVTTQWTIPSIYHARTSGDICKPTFKWHGDYRREVSELEDLVYKAIEEKTSIEDFAKRVFSFDYDFPEGTVLAWNFVEVY